MANALIGERDLALKEAERAMTLNSSAKDPMFGPCLEDTLAVIQTILGEISRAISLSRGCYKRQ